MNIKFKAAEIHIHCLKFDEWFPSRVACDLPQRPNEAHIFYGNMSKVVVSLLGSTKNTDFEESEHALLLPSAKSSSETDR